VLAMPQNVDKLRRNGRLTVGARHQPSERGR
jgi:hypothetical protein